MARTRKEASAYPPGAAVVDRMQAAYGVESLAALAHSLGEGESTVKNWRYRGSVPTDYLVKTSKDTKRSVDWLLMGEQPNAHGPDFLLQDGTVVEAKLVLRENGPPQWLGPDAGPPAASTGKAVSTRTRGTQAGGAQRVRDGALLPVTGAAFAPPLVMNLRLGEQGEELNYEVIPRMTHGADLSSATAGVDRAGNLAMNRQWLAAHLQHTTGQLMEVQMVGDSMSPTLLDGEMILVDCGVTKVVVDDIYVVDMLGQRLVKRLQRKTDGSLVIISDNAAYEREVVPRARVNEIAVFGRKVWPRTR